MVILKMDFWNKIKSNMVKAQKRAFTTLNKTKKQKLGVTKTNQEIFDIHKKVLVLFGIVWILLCLLLIVFSYLKTKKIGFNLIFIAYPIILVISIIFFNTSEYKFKKLLRNIVEKLELKTALNQKVKIEYTRNNESTVIKVFSVIANDKADLLVREIASYFQRKLKKTFIIDDYKILSDSFTVYFSHVEDERINFSNLDELRTRKGITSLTTKIIWDRKKQPMGLIVGPTASGKTSLLKVIIISFLANDNKNTLYIIDGKSSFLSVATSHFFNKKQTATTSSSAVEIVAHLNDLMNERYSRMNADFQDEKDQTYDEKFNSGCILLVVDELLSLVSEMQASDKQLKTNERLYPQFYSRLLSLIVKGRAASIFVIVSGQQIPASILPTEARDSLGFRIALSRISQSQAIEIFGESARNLPSTDEEYSGLIWLDGLGWRTPKILLSPYYNENKLPFKKTLFYLKKKRQTDELEK